MSIDPSIPIENTAFYHEHVETLTLGRVIRAWRKCEERTLEEVAQSLGISKQQLSKYERGEKLPSLQKTIELATALNAPVLFWVQQRLNDEMAQTSLDVTVKLEPKRA